MTTVINAAMANAMMAHANETDDAHHGSHCHPGCAAVPAALAIAEKNNTDGLSLINGRYFKEHVVNWRGKAENPMNSEDVEQ